MPHRGEIRIAVVDDNPIMQQILVKSVSKYVNIKVRPEDLFTDGLSLLEALAENRYHLILLDIEMPILDGLQTVMLIRNPNEDPTSASVLHSIRNSVSTSSSTSSTSSSVSGPSPTVRQLRYALSNVGSGATSALQNPAAADNVLAVNRGIPIIAVTGNAFLDQQRRHCLNVGFTDVISKPVTPEILKGVFEKYVGIGLGATLPSGESLKPLREENGGVGECGVGGTRSLGRNLPPLPTKEAGSGSASPIPSRASGDGTGGRKSTLWKDTVDDDTPGGGTGGSRQSALWKDTGDDDTTTGSKGGGLWSSPTPKETGEYGTSDRSREGSQRSSLWKSLDEGDANGAGGGSGIVSSGRVRKPRGSSSLWRDSDSESDVSARNSDADIPRTSRERKRVQSTPGLGKSSGDEDAPSDSEHPTRSSVLSTTSPRLSVLHHEEDHHNSEPQRLSAIGRSRSDQPKSFGAARSREHSPDFPVSAEMQPQRNGRLSSSAPAVAEAPPPVRRMSGSTPRPLEGEVQPHAPTGANVHRRRLSGVRRASSISRKAPEVEGIGAASEAQS
ncbi:hypothetical protein HDV00_005202 [Rhizophlyctis rosea]|nr:hypothetical protein HDV00_005202 [Rhizophlyctis rosea]